MGWSRKRKGADGKIRYSAEYRDIRGVKRSAGTFASRKEADKAWQKAEARASEGRTTPVRRGAIRFEPYVRDTWFPNHLCRSKNRDHLVTCCSSGYQAARAYSLIRPPRTGLRR